VIKCSCHCVGQPERGAIGQHLIPDGRSASDAERGKVAGDPDEGDVGPVLTGGHLPAPGPLALHQPEAVPWAWSV
jgi:hypothetical protein